MIDRVMEVEEELSHEHGSFRLFGLFLRANSADEWDVVVAASWFADLKGVDAIDLLSERLKAALGRSGLLMISRVVALTAQDRFLADVNELVKTEHEPREFSNVDLAGIHVKRAFVITSIPRE